MGTQPFREKERKTLQKQISVLYKQGLSFRAIGKTLDISHETARQMWLSTQVSDIALTQIDNGSKIEIKESEGS